MSDSLVCYCLGQILNLFLKIAITSAVFQSEGITAYFKDLSKSIVKGTDIVPLSSLRTRAGILSDPSALFGSNEFRLVTLFFFLLTPTIMMMIIPAHKGGCC